MGLNHVWTSNRQFCRLVTASLMTFSIRKRTAACHLHSLYWEVVKLEPAWIVSGNGPDWIKDILASLAIRGVKTPLHHFDTDVGTKSMGDDLAGMVFSCFTTSSTVTLWVGVRSAHHQRWMCCTSNQPVGSCMIVSFMRRSLLLL